MRRVIFCLLVIFSVSKTFAQLPETVTWNTNIKMDKHIFPSYIIAGSTVKFADLGENYLGEPKGLLGIDIASTYRNATYKLEIKANEIAEVSTYEFTLPHEKRREIFYVFPNINYNYQALKKIDQPTPVNITFTLYINGVQHSQKTETVSVHSVNDCPFYVKNTDESLVNMTWMFAAYVNENHPLIEDILREAINTELVDQFTDYQLASSDNIDEVFRQAIAVWAALYNRKMTYSNTVTPSLVPGNTVYCQRVRFFNDAMRSAQANCVDGSAVFSSVYRRIGIEPFLIIIPGHCFMGFYIDRDKTKLYCLETTVIGNRKITEEDVDADELKFFMELFPKEVREKNKAAIMSFTYALQNGMQEYEKAKPNIEAKKLQYEMIDIENSRKEFGVIPIAN